MTDPQALLNQRYDIYLTGQPPRYIGTGRLEYAQALGHYQISFAGAIDLFGWLTVPALALPAVEAPAFDEGKVVFEISRGYAVAIMRVVWTPEQKQSCTYADLRFPAAALKVIEKEIAK